MTIALNEQEEKLIQQRVAAGEFPSPEAAVHEAIVKMLGTYRPMTAQRMNELVDAGVRDLDESRVMTAEQMDERWAALRSDFKARQSAK